MANHDLGSQYDWVFQDYDEELNSTELHPAMVRLMKLQHNRETDLWLKHASERVRLALQIRKENK